MAENDILAIELALSVAEDAAKNIIAEWQRHHQDDEFLDNPANRAVYELATGTLAAIEQYRANRITPEEMHGETTL